jgi:hypothetical protein
MTVKISLETGIMCEHHIRWNYCRSHTKRAESLEIWSPQILDMFDEVPWSSGPKPKPLSAQGYERPDQPVQTAM